MSKEIEVVWMGGQRGSWCHGIVEFLTQGFAHRMDVKELQGEGAIIVIKADWDKNPAKFCEDTAHLKWILLFVTANEEGNSNYHKSLSPNCKVWLQTPHRHQTCDRAIPWGWTPNCRVDAWPERTLDYSFAGQITHKRRWDLMEALPEVAMVNRKWEFHGSDGFAKGISQAEYYGLMARSKVIPCPSGPVTVDSFRVCEALELGAVPILDTWSPRGPYPEYWQRVFPRHPFETLDNWRMFPFQLEHILRNWSMVSEVVQRYWAQWKAKQKEFLLADLKELGAVNS